MKSKYFVENPSILTKEELKKTVQSLRKLAKQRITRFEKSGYQGLSNPINQLKDKDLSIRGKNINQLRNLYSQLYNFMQAETSTKRGFERVKKEQYKYLQKEGKTGKDILEEIKVNPEKEKEFWQTYNKVAEKNKFIRGHTSTQVQSALKRVIYDNSANQLIKEINEHWSKYLKRPTPNRKDTWVDEWGKTHRVKKNLSEKNIIELFAEYEKVVYERGQLERDGKWVSVFGGNKDKI